MARKRKTTTVEDGWEAVEGGEIQKWEKGLIIQGIFKEIRDSLGKYKSSKLFDIEVMDTETGEMEYSTYGAPRLLASKLKRMNPGDMIRIECLGKIPTPNGNAWDFIVMRKKGR